MSPAESLFDANRMPKIHSVHVLDILPNHPITTPRERLDKGQLGGSNVESVNIRGQAGVGLLGTVRTAVKY